MTNNNNNVNAGTKVIELFQGYLAFYRGQALKTNRGRQYKVFATKEQALQAASERAARDEAK